MFSSIALRSPQRSFATASKQPILATRQLHSSSTCLARKDTQDRESINVESNEYSKSGGDNATAATEDAAFNPQKTSPEEERKTAKRESGGESKNPLNASPANTNLGKPAGGKPRAEGSQAETGEGSANRSGTSGGGSPRKDGGKK
ncbi:Hypothetical protein R9X50_00103200 [Acrodontium crateriforme]|uniref:Uncharacterized protein n=1 Tax=Acrodontium crateriforme TaxID=150365 RepID=A0AAQ3R7R4_9PEZI|nr:Hypothetical protein R9X50_00103200 [Acrodontium crateriforme]